MGLIEILLLFVLLGVTLFPLMYAIYKRVANKLLFVSACIGLGFIIQLLVVIASAPFAFFLIKIAPQLAEMELLNNIIWLLIGVDYISEWWLVVLHPLASILLPLAIYKRYIVFHLTRPSI